MFCRYCLTRNISNQSFQSKAIPRRNADVSMHAESADRSAAWSHGRIESVAVNVITELDEAAPRIRPRGDSAADRGGINRRQARLFTREGIIGIVIRT